MNRHSSQARITSSSASASRARLEAKPAEDLWSVRSLLLLAVLLVATLAVLLAGSPSASAETYSSDDFVDSELGDEVDGRYTYLRVVDGNPILFNAKSEDRIEAVANYPILTGDRLIVPRNSRVDTILSDGNQLALTSGSEIEFVNLSGSPDGRSDDEGTLVRLVEGELYLGVGFDRLSEFYPVVDTANARIYIQEDGAYRVEANDRDSSLITVISGSLEVLTRSDSYLLTAGEALAVEGYSDLRVRTTRASYSDLQAWAEEQNDRFNRGYSSSLNDDRLADTAQLDSRGDWVKVDTTVVWRPRVESTWRPYNNGRWAHTPSGLFWVSYDPWVPVTYRYGTWDLSPNYGWVWYPGHIYRPAHVYWYWGSSYAGWIPSGYYNRYYGPRYAGFGFRSGIIGYSGFGWDPFNDWVFCPVRYIGYRDSYRHYDYGHNLAQRGVHFERGIIASSSRRISRDEWQRPALIGSALERGWKSDSRGENLPDATSFVSRRDLTPEAKQALLVKRSSRSGDAADTRRASTTDRSAQAGSSVRSGSDGSAVAQSSSRSSSSAQGNTRSATRADDLNRSSAVRSSSSSANRSPATRTTEPSATGRSRGEATGTATSTRGAVRRDSGASTVNSSSSRSSSPARRVIDGAGSRDRQQAPAATRSQDRATAPPTSDRGAVRRDSGQASSARSKSTPPAETSGRSQSSSQSSTSQGSTRSSTPAATRSSDRSSSSRSSSSTGAKRREPPSASVNSSANSSAQRSASPRVNAPAQRSAVPRSSAPAARSSAPAQRSSAPRASAPAQRATAPRSSAPAQRSTAPAQRQPAPRASAPAQPAPSRASAPPQRSSAPRSTSARSAPSRASSPPPATARSGSSSTSSRSSASSTSSRSSRSGSSSATRSSSSRSRTKPPQN